MKTGEAQEDLPMALLRKIQQLLLKMLMPVERRHLHDHICRRRSQSVCSLTMSVCLCLLFLTQCMLRSQCWAFKQPFQGSCHIRILDSEHST